MARAAGTGGTPAAGGRRVGCGAASPGVPQARKTPKVFPAMPQASRADAPLAGNRTRRRQLLGIH
jgi:hypothetical protein